MLKHVALIAACIIGVVVGYCLPHTPVLTDIKDGEDYSVATFLEDSKNAGNGVFIYDGGHCTASNKQVIDSPVKHAPLHDGANYIVKFNDTFKYSPENDSFTWESLSTCELTPDSELSDGYSLFEVLAEMADFIRRNANTPNCAVYINGIVVWESTPIDSYNIDNSNLYFDE